MNPKNNPLDMDPLSLLTFLIEERRINQALRLENEQLKEEDRLLQSLNNEWVTILEKCRRLLGADRIVHVPAVLERLMVAVNYEADRAGTVLPDLSKR